MQVHPSVFLKLFFGITASRGGAWGSTSEKKEGGEECWKKCWKIKQNRSVAKKNLDGATKFYFLQPNENLGCNIATSANSQIHTLPIGQEPISCFEWR